MTQSQDFVLFSGAHLVALALILALAVVVSRTAARDHRSQLATH